MGNQCGAPDRIRAAVSAAADAAIAASSGKAGRRQLTSALAYWIFAGTFGLVVVAFGWLAWHTWGLVALGLAGVVTALILIAWKLALLAALRRHPAAGPPTPRRTPRAVVSDWAAAHASMYREFRAAFNHDPGQRQPAGERPQPDSSPER
jgi:MFS family permease